MEELRNFYSLPDVIRMIKSGKINLTWHVADMREINSYIVLILLDYFLN